MTTSHTSTDLSPEVRAARVLEERNRAFRVLYDTVMEVEGASEDRVYAILCRNLRRICNARCAVLGEYEPDAETLALKAIDHACDQPHASTPLEKRQRAVVSPEMLERYTEKQVRACTRHTRCPLDMLGGPTLDTIVAGEEAAWYCLSCIREKRLIAVAKVFLPARTRLKLKDLIDTYMNLAGMILQRVQAVRALRESEEKYRHVVERANDGITIVQDGRLAFVNERLAEIIGHNPADLLGLPFAQFVCSQDRPRLLDRYQRRLAGEPLSPVYETALIHRNGEIINVELNVGVVAYRDEPAELIIIRDISERKQAEEELRRKNRQLADLNAELTVLSRVDPLTKVFNRRAWEQAVDQEHERFERNRCCYSIVMIDVDCFKAFNDTCGHQAGDECLRQVAGAIADSCRRLETVGRYGGEEFTVLAPDTDLQGALRLAERIRNAIWSLAMPHPASPVAERVTISLGVAASEPGSWERVLKHADEALYLAKKAGRNMVFGDRNADQCLGAQHDRNAEATPLATGPTGGLVLVVGDDPEFHGHCRKHLGRHGYRIEYAGNGAQLIEQAAKCQPAVILVNTPLPDMDPLECLSLLKADPVVADVPVILAGDVDNDPGVAQALEAGVDEFLAKPIRGSELTLRARSMIRQHENSRTLLQSYAVRGEHVRTLTCLVEYCRVVATSQNLEEVLGHTLSTAAALVQCRRAAVLLPTAEDEVLYVRQAIGIDAHDADNIRVPSGEPLSGQAFRTGRPLVLNNSCEAREHQPFHDAGFFIEPPLASIPLGSNESTVGVLNLTDRIGGRPFAAHEIGYLELIAGLASTAIVGISSRQAQDRATESMMVALVRLAEHRDNDTGQHVDRVTRYSRILAEELQRTTAFRHRIDDTFLADLVRSVPLHDLGKVAIPDQILLHPGRLSAEQMAVMRTHAAIGAQTIRTLLDRISDVGFLTMAADIAHHHHEWYDGTGYPTGLAGEAIPLAARIVALADVYDALVTRRVYKNMVSHAEAVTIISDRSGTHFDPHVVNAFLKSQERFLAIRNACTA